LTPHRDRPSKCRAGAKSIINQRAGRRRFRVPSIASPTASPDASFLFQLIDNRDQQSGRELTRHRDGLVHDLASVNGPSGGRALPFAVLISCGR
jgi:hypothetical protein